MRLRHKEKIEVLMSSSEEKSFRSGFVAILGRPNAGKSTLLNRFVGQKIAIVTSKPQTTRNRIQGIVNRSDGQIVFIDTPGLHLADSQLGRQMVNEIAAALDGVDLLLLVVDASWEAAGVDETLIQRAKRFGGAVILALNKIDQVPKRKLLPLIDSFRKAFDFAAIVPISALKGDGCEQLLQEVMARLPEGEPYFGKDQVTDQPERFLAAEIIREKAIRLTYHEVPHALAVVVDQFDESPRLVRIHATLKVERDSQKKILIGSKGAMLKRVGTEARKEMETLLGTKVFLELYVKVVPNWRENPQEVRQLNWHEQLKELGGGESEE
jgi:GTP-binding protein Era